MRRKEDTVKNVFRDGTREPAREHFTEVWISMINGIERGKSTTTVHR